MSVEYRTLTEALNKEFLGVQVIMAKYYGISRQGLRSWLQAGYLVDEHLNVLKFVKQGKENYD